MYPAGSDFFHPQDQINVQDVQERNQRDMEDMIPVVVGTAINFFIIQKPIYENDKMTE